MYYIFKIQGKGEVRIPILWDTTSDSNFYIYYIQVPIHLLLLGCICTILSDVSIKLNKENMDIEQMKSNQRPIERKYKNGGTQVPICLSTFQNTTMLQKITLQLIPLSSAFRTLRSILIILENSGKKQQIKISWCLSTKAEILKIINIAKGVKIRRMEKKYKYTVFFFTKNRKKHGFMLIAHL